MAEELGVQILYEAEVIDLLLENGLFTSAVAHYCGTRHTVAARAVVVASGGYQANLDWLKEHWGNAADNFIVRGTPFDKGTMLRVLLLALRTTSAMGFLLATHIGFVLGLFITMPYGKFIHAA